MTPVAPMTLGPFAQFSGASCMKNQRPYQEDTYDICFHAERKVPGLSCPPTHYWGVFDGHGGPKTSKFLAKQLLETVIETPEFARGNLHGAIEAGFAAADSALVAMSRTKAGLDDGSTCCTVFLQGSTLCCANVGDSRAVLSVNGKAMALSNDHKPNRPSERKRIEQHGGFVQTMGVPRVMGVLAVARAFGDVSLKPYICATPEIMTVELSRGGEEEFVVVASDGLWDVMSNQEAIDIASKALKKEGSWEAAAKVLTKRAASKGSMDNTTVVLISLDCAAVCE